MILCRTKIGLKLFLLVLSACLICSAGLGVYSYYKLKNAIKEKIDIQYLSRLVEARSLMEHYFEDAYSELLFLSSLPDLHIISSLIHTAGTDIKSNAEYLQSKKYIENIFKEKLISHPKFTQIRFLCENGIERIRVDNTGDSLIIIPFSQLQDKSHRYYYMNIIAGNENELYVSKVDLNHEYREIQKPYVLTIRFGIPFVYNGKFLGALVINANVGLLLKDIEKLFLLHEGENLFMIDSDGYFIENYLYPEYKWGAEYNLNTGHNIKGIYNEQILEELITNDSDIIQYNKHVIYYTKISLQNNYMGTLAIDIPLSHILSPLHKFTLVSIIFLMIFLSVVIILSYILTQNIVRPLAKLNTGMERIMNSDYSILLPVQSQDEIGQLTKRFNAMSTNLQKKTARLVRLFELGIADQKNASDIFDKVVNIIVSTIKIEICAIGVIKDKDIKFLSFYDKGYFSKEQKLCVNNNPCLNTILNKKIHLVTNAFEEHQDSDFIRENDIHTLLAVPVISSEDKVIGVILVMDRRVIKIPDDDIELMYTLSRRVSFEVEQAQKNKEIIEKDSKVEYLSKYVPLTDLPNENYMLEMLEHAIKQAKQVKGVIGLIRIKIFNYSLIQSNYGSHFADIIVRTIAQKLSKFISDTDILAHTSHSQFTIAFTSLKSKDKITYSLIQIEKQFEKPQSIKRVDVFIRLKFGMSIYPSDATNAINLIKRADLALGVALEQFQKSYVLYTKEIESVTTSKMNIENALINGLENNKFSIVFQPQVNSRTRQIIGSEALLRFHDPQIGDVSPIKFIPIIEETGLIFKVGEWVLETACRQTKSLHDSGFKNLQISVNISSVQFKDEEFISTIKRILSDTQIDPKTLEIEITEGIIIEDFAHVNRRIKELHQLGISVAIDDFGTGYSSMKYLRIFAIDKLKIDRAFVKDIPENDDGAIATTIINLAKNFNMDVIAEGAETDEQIAFLQKYGCDMIQGYYFSPPIKYDKYIEYLKNFK